jgi:hypothetical protein
LSWQLRCASKVECGCRVCRNACLHVGQYCERDYISVQFCLLFFCHSVLCCAVRVCAILCWLCCACVLYCVGGRCGRFRCAVNCGGRCAVRRKWSASSVGLPALHVGQFCFAIPCRPVLRCVILRSGQSLRVLHFAVCAPFCAGCAVACALLCGRSLRAISLCGKLWCCAVPLLSWQVRCASNVECGCRGCRNVCTLVRSVNEIIFQSSFICCFFAILFCAVLCVCAPFCAGCAVRVCSAVWAVVAAVW